MDIKPGYKLIPYQQKNITTAPKLTSDLNIDQSPLRNRESYTQNKNYRYFEKLKTDYTVYNKKSFIVSTKQSITGSLINIFV